MRAVLTPEALFDPNRAILKVPTSVCEAVAQNDSDTFVHGVAAAQGWNSYLATRSHVFSSICGLVFTLAIRNSLWSSM